MAIPLTWNNIFRLTGLITVVLATMAAGMSFMVQRQLDEVGKRLNDRLAIYQRDQFAIQHEVDRMLNRLERLEQSK